MREFTFISTIFLHIRSFVNKSLRSAQLRAIIYFFSVRIVNVVTCRASMATYQDSVLRPSARKTPYKTHRKLRTKTRTKPSRIIWAPLYKPAKRNLARNLDLLCMYMGKTWKNLHILFLQNGHFVLFSWSARFRAGFENTTREIPHETHMQGTQWHHHTMRNVTSSI